MIMETFLLVYIILLIFVLIPVMVMIFISDYRKNKGFKRIKWFPKFFEDEIE